MSGHVTQRMPVAPRSGLGTRGYCIAWRRSPGVGRNSWRIRYPCPNYYIKNGKYCGRNWRAALPKSGRRSAGPEQREADAAAARRHRPSRPRPMRDGALADVKSQMDNRSRRQGKTVALVNRAQGGVLAISGAYDPAPGSSRVARSICVPRATLPWLAASACDLRVIASPAGTPPGASRNAALAPHSMSESMASLAPHSRSPGLRGLGVRPFSSLPNSHCSVMFTSHASCGAIPQWARTAARRISLATL